MIKAAIFDLDGILLNTLEDVVNACNYALKKCNFKTHSIEEYKVFVGDGRSKLIERIVPDEYKGNDEVKNKVLRLFDEYYSGHMLDMTKPYEGICEMLKSLKEKGVKLAVVSNKPDEFVGGIVKKYFGDTFEIVHGQRTNYPVKPDPTTVYEVIEYFGIKLNESIYVGDSNVDIYTAKNAKVKSIGVAWGFRGEEELREAGADYIVYDSNEITELILS